MRSLPPELYGEILRFLGGDIPSLRTCTHVNSELCDSARLLLFEYLYIGTPRSSATEQQDIHSKVHFYTITSPHLLPCVRRVTLDLDAIRTSAMDDQVGTFLAQLVNIRVMVIDQDTPDDWFYIDAALRLSLTKIVFPRLTTLSISHVLKLPFLTFISSFHRLQHLLLRQFTPSNDDSITQLAFSTTLQSLTVDTYWKNDFIESSSLAKMVEISRGSLKAVVLRKHIWGLTNPKSSLASADGLLRQCHTNLIHLHLGPEIYQKIVYRMSIDADHLDLSSCIALQTIQFEICYPESPLFVNSSVFFSWLASELAELGQRSSTLRSIILDVDKPEILPEVQTGKTWNEIDELLTGSVFPDFSRFRVRLERHTLEDSKTLHNHQQLFCRMLPLSDASGFVMVEYWDQRNAMVNSAVRETCNLTLH